MAIVRCNPMRDMMNIEREFGNIFNNFEKKFGFSDVDKETQQEYSNAVWMPLTDISEDENKYYLKLDLPGIKKEGVKINYHNGHLTIGGERKQETEEKNAKYHRVERTFGKYFRSFALPEKIKENEIDAEYSNGQLKITIPKSEEARNRQIEIRIK